MTSLGGHATCRSMDIDFLKTGIVEKVATPNKMEFLSGTELRWSIGLDSSNNFVLKNEMIDAKSITADNDTGLVSILNSGIGNTNLLKSLNDVIWKQDTSHNSLMFYDDLSGNFKFSTDIFLNKLDASAIDTNVITATDQIICMNSPHNPYIVIDNSSIYFHSDIQFKGNGKLIVEPIRTKPISGTSNGININLTPPGYDTLLLYDSSTKEVQQTTHPKVYKMDVNSLDVSNIIHHNPIQVFGNLPSVVNPFQNSGLVFDENSITAVNVAGFPVNTIMSNVDANNVKVANIDASGIHFKNNIIKVGFQLNNVNGSNNVYTVASFKVSNASSVWNFGHVQLHYAVQHHLTGNFASWSNTSSYGGGEAHGMIYFEQNFPSTQGIVRHLNKINTDGAIKSVHFALTFTSPDIINVTYRNSNSHSSSVTGTIEWVISNASIVQV